MRQFKREGRILYLAEDSNSQEHFVPNVNWEEYLVCRLNMPKLCHIYDTVDEAQQAALSTSTGFIIHGTKSGRVIE